MGEGGERGEGRARVAVSRKTTWVLSSRSGRQAASRSREVDGRAVISTGNAPIGSRLRIRGASPCPSANPSARCRGTCTRRPHRCSARRAVICSGSGSTHPLAARTSARKRTPIPPRRRAVTESSPHTNARIGTSPETEPVSRAQKRPTLCRREIDCVAFSEFIRVGVGGYNVTNVRFCVIRYLDSLLYFLPDCLRTESFLISEEWKTRSHSHKFETFGSRKSAPRRWA